MFRSLANGNLNVPLKEHSRSLLALGLSIGVHCWMMSHSGSSIQARSSHSQVSLKLVNYSPPTPKPVEPQPQPEVQPPPEPQPKPVISQVADPILPAKKIVEPQEVIKEPPPEVLEESPIEVVEEEPVEVVEEPQPEVVKVDPPEVFQESESVVEVSNAESASEDTHLLLEDVINQYLQTSNVHAYYPRRAKRRKVEGLVALELVFDAQGKLTHFKIQQKSGSKMLDQAALLFIQHHQQQLMAVLQNAGWHGDESSQEYVMIAPFNFQMASN